MNFGVVVKAFDTFMALRSVARTFKGDPPPPDPGGALTQPTGLAGQIESRLTNVVMAALKEAFDRDSARLELEREQLEEERRRADEARRRAEEAMRLELRRQAADRELGRLRMLVVISLFGWIASVLMLVARLPEVSNVSRAVLAVGWLLLLAALGSAFSAQARVGRDITIESVPGSHGAQAAAGVWLLIGGLGLSAISLLL